MKKTLIFLAIALAASFSIASASTIHVGPPSYCTDNTQYDRNPSVTFDGSNYWLFYTKGDDSSTEGVRGTSYNPDGDTYVVYYKQSSTIAGLTTASETKLELSESNRPAGFDQRVVSAVFFNAHIYAFVSSGQSGTDRGLYYYEFDGGDWSGPITLISDATARGGHVNVVTNGSYVYIVWESSDGSSDCYSWDGTTLSSKIDISDGNQPKITYFEQNKSGNIFVVNIEDGTGDIEVYIALASPNPLFSHHSTAISGSGFYDPCIFTDNTDLYVVAAPYVDAEDRQYLFQTKFTVATSTWSSTHRISYAGYAGESWWDFWPCGYFDNSEAYVFFATEGRGNQLGNCEIAFIKMDWDIEDDHYFAIQNAVDFSSADDFIEINPGLYREQVVIQTANLTLYGLGSSDDPSTNTIIVSPEHLAYSFNTGSYDNFPVVGIDGVTGVTLSGMRIDGDHQGANNYRFDGLAFWNSGGSVSNVQIVNVMNSTLSGAQHGVGIYSNNNTGGPYTIGLAGINVHDFQKNAIALTGSGLTVTLDNVTAIGYGATDITAQNGIQIGPGATGAVSNCTVSAINYTGSGWASSGLLVFSNLDVDGISIDQCQTSVYWSDGSGTFNNGTITNPIGDGFYANNSTSARLDSPRRKCQPIDADNRDNLQSTIMNVSITNSTFTGSDIMYSWGIGAFSTSPDALNLTVDNCFISNWDYGIFAYDYGYGSAVNVTAADNSITACTYAFGSTMTSIQDASRNWLGTFEPTEIEALFDGYIDFTPWLGSGDDSQPSVAGFQPYFDEVWIDDDSPQTDGGNRIDEAVSILTGTTVHIAPGTYSESMIFPSAFDRDGLIFTGDASDLPVITGGVHFLQTAQIDGITFENLYFKGVAPGSDMVVDMDNSGTVNDMALDNCVIDAENTPNRYGFGGQNLSQSFSITNTEFKDILGWAVMDLESGSGDGGSNLPLTIVTFANNNVHQVNGSIALRGNSSDLTNLVEVYGNTFTDIGGNESLAGEHWAAFEVNHADAANIYGNIITNVVEGEWGEGQGIQMWDIGALDMHDNIFTDCFQGMFVFGGGGAYGGPYAIPSGTIYNNTFTNCDDYIVSVADNATGTALNAEHNYWGTMYCPAIAAQVLGEVDFEPYCNAALTSCDYTCEVNYVWVDDDWAGTPDGADLGSGMIFNFNAFDNIADAVAAVNSGGEVYIYNGNYQIDGVEIDKSLTLRGESQTGVVIAPEAESVYGFLYSASNLTIKNITMDGNANTSLPTQNNFIAGIAFATGTAADNITVDSVTVRNVYSFAIGLGNSATPNATGLSVTNCTVESVQVNYGIWIKYGDSQITGNHIDGIPYAAISNQYGTSEIHDNTIENADFLGIITWTNTSDPTEFGTMNTSGNVLTNVYYGIVCVGDAVITDNTVTATSIGIWSASNLYTLGIANNIVMQGNTVTLTGDYATGFNMCNTSDGSLLGGSLPAERNTVIMHTSLVNTGRNQSSPAPMRMAAMGNPPDEAEPTKPKLATPADDGVLLDGGEGSVGILVWWCPSGNQLHIENNYIECEGSNSAIWLYHNDATAAPVVFGNELVATGSSSSAISEGVGIFVTDDGAFVGEGGGGDSYGELNHNLISGFVDGIYIYENTTHDAVATAANNTLANNANAVFVNSQDNTFYGNYFICNTATATDDGSTNNWDNGSGTGNFWDDFHSNSGYSTIYNIAGTAGSIDHYPWSKNPAQVFVDDDWAGTACGDSVDGHLFGYNAFAEIQEGIYAVVGGGNVNVAAGTYREQLKIERKNIVLDGSGMADCIIEAVDIGDRTTYTITQWSGSEKTIDACIGVVDAYSVEISGFTIDGRELGPNNFYGIHYFDTDGTIDECRVENITSAASPSASSIVSIVATHSVTGSFDVEVDNCEVTNFQKGGIVFMGPNGNCVLHTNTVEGVINPSLAPNGIQVSYGCTGTLINNNVSTVAYPGDNWAGTCILLMETDDVMIINGVVEGCEIGIGYSQWNWIYTPTSTPTVTIDGTSLNENQWAVSAHLGDDGVDLNIEVKNCVIDNSAYSGVDMWGSEQDPWGGSYYGGWTNGNLIANVHDNHITNSSDAVVEEVYLTTGNSVDFTAIKNDYTGSSEYGVYNNFTNMLDATQCFWGDTQGPLAGTNRGGNEAVRVVAIPVSPGDSEPKENHRIKIPARENKDLVLEGATVNVDYSPWWGDNYVDDGHSGIWNWYMDNSNASSVQEAVDYTLSGDSIFVYPGIYTGAGNRDIDFGGKELVLKSLESAHTTIIDCGLAGRAFRFHSGESNATVVSGFTLKNGSVTFNGGAILCELTSSPTIQHCVIIGNVVNGFGGGIACDGGSNPVILNNTISKNTANGPFNSGGGIYCFDSSPIIKNTIVYENYGAGQNQIYSYTTDSFEPQVCYCDIQNGWLGESVIDVDPLFRSTNLNDPDFHLTAIDCGDAQNSPCIDAGHPNYSDWTLTCDFGLGSVRSDMGAYGGGIFIGGFSYVPGDANMIHGIWPPAVIGSDVTYLVNFFRGLDDPCYLNGFYAAADVNGDCQVIGSDVTRLVNYFRGLTDISFCSNFTPAWLTPADCPTDKPAGWPYCETTSLGSGAHGKNINK